MSTLSTVTVTSSTVCSIDNYSHHDAGKIMENKKNVISDVNSTWGMFKIFLTTLKNKLETFGLNETSNQKINEEQNVIKLTQVNFIY